MINKKIKVIVVDDNQFVCFAIKEMLNECDFVESVKISPKISNLYEDLIKHKNDMIVVFVIDINIIRSNKEDILKIINNKTNDIKIIALLSERDNINYDNIIIDGVIDKSSDLSSIYYVLKLVTYGFQCIPKKYVNINRDKAELLDLLTKREKEVFHCITEGMSNKDIADNLHISNKTVSVHRFNIMFKMGVKKPIDLLKINSSY